jgi:hypothetical protein
MFCWYSVSGPRTFDLINKVIKFKNSPANDLIKTMSEFNSSSLILDNYSLAVEFYYPNLQDKM